MIFHREHPLGQLSVPAFTEIAQFLLRLEIRLKETV